MSQHARSHFSILSWCMGKFFFVGQGLVFESLLVFFTNLTIDSAVSNFHLSVPNNEHAELQSLFLLVAISLKSMLWKDVSYDLISAQQACWIIHLTWNWSSTVQLLQECSINMILPSCKVLSRNEHFKFDLTGCQRKGRKREGCWLLSKGSLTTENLFHSV